jgi:phosphoribosylformylglycinamidine synthase
MATAPRALILRAPGTTCDGETAYAFELTGAEPEIVHIRRLIDSPRLLAEFQIFCIPGGFSYGDDIASGRILALELEKRLSGALQEFRAADKLILGICNGFQTLLRCGLLSDVDQPSNPPATLTWNTSGRFEARWVHLATAGDRCPFLKGIERLYLPVAHAQGRFVAKDETTLAQLERDGQCVLRYIPIGDAGGTTARFDQPLPFPDNPNGAQANVAGMCDATGRIFGLMPHPERFVDPTQHPRWTRGQAPAVGDGLLLFRGAVNYFR